MGGKAGIGGDMDLRGRPSGGTVDGEVASAARACWARYRCSSAVPDFVAAGEGETVALSRRWELPSPADVLALEFRHCALELVWGQPGAA